MDGIGAGIGRLDNYEDMFKEITRKLYGEDPDHRISSVQNEFETSTQSFKAEFIKSEDDTGNGTDNSDDGKWYLDDEPMKGTEGCLVAAYHAEKSTWKCYECGDYVLGGPRDMAEHFAELHSSRLLGAISLDDARMRHQQLPIRKDYLSNQSTDLKLDDLVAYLQCIKDQAERIVGPPLRRTQETQTLPSSLLPITSSFLLQELPPTPPQQLLQNTAILSSPSLSQSPPTPSSPPTPVVTEQIPVSNTPPSVNPPPPPAPSGNGITSGKRYTCVFCPYGTDRRDLYTRHENIHKAEKPFHCYVCFKPFSRADHVKKHFLRMHRDHTYELAKIRKVPGSSSGQQQIKNEHTIITTAAVPDTSIIASSQINHVRSFVNNNNNNNDLSNNNNNNDNNNCDDAQQQMEQQQDEHQQQTLAYTFNDIKPFQLQASDLQFTIKDDQLHLIKDEQLQLLRDEQLQLIKEEIPTSLPTGITIQQTSPSIATVVVVNGNHLAAPLTTVTVTGSPTVTTGKNKTQQNGGAQKSSKSKGNQEKRYTCVYCPWSGVDNWCLKRHLNTHLKPFACTLCEYKAARSERLSTHVLKVHNRRQCSRCSFLAEDLNQLQVHQLQVHHMSSASAAGTITTSSKSQKSNDNNVQPQQMQQLQQENDEQESQSQQQLQHSQEQQKTSPISGGRPPPGPPVFPASPSASVILPTTILGYFGGKENYGSRSRSRKQRQPKKMIVLPEEDEKPLDLVTKRSDEVKEEIIPEVEKIEKILNERLRCFRCPKKSVARAYRVRPYHSRISLHLHNIWRHRINQSTNQR